MKYQNKLNFVKGFSALLVSTTLSSQALAAPVTYNTGTDSLTNATNTTEFGGSLSTTGAEAEGAYLTGSGSGTHQWFFNGSADLTVTASGNAGYYSDISSGDNRVFFNGSTIVGNAEAGIKIETTGNSSTLLDINNGTTITGGSTGANSAGIYVDSTASQGVDIDIDSTSSVTNGAGEAAIDLVSVGSFTSYLANSGTVSGGAASGHGIYVHENADTVSILNSASGTITGGDTGTSHGILIEGNGSSINVLDVVNSGSISGGATLGDGIVLSNNGEIDDLTNNADISGGGGDSRGIELTGSAAIDTITNSSAGTITGGAGGADGIFLDDDSSITTITNRGTIDGADTSGSAINIRGNAFIGTITNGSIGTITQANSGIGYGILVQGDSAGDTATISTIDNSNDIFGNTGSAAIGLLGGDDLAGETRVTTNLINNRSAGLIQGRNGGNGIIVGGHHTVNSLVNSGDILSNNTTGGTVSVTDNGIINLISISNSGASISNTSGTTGYGVLAEGIATGDAANILQINNAFGSIIGGSDAAIGLLGGDATTSVTTNSISNLSSGSIVGSNGGDGIQIGNYHTLTSLTNNATIHGDGSTGNGIDLSGNAILTTINNQSTGSIAGSSTSSHGTGINVRGNSAITTITNSGDILSSTSFLGSGGAGINITDNGAVTTIDNIGVIGTASTGMAINVGGSATLTTINNYSSGSISASTAIDLNNTASSTTINTSGSMTGDIQLGSTTGTGDTVNIYDGSIFGDILGVDASGSYGTVNFNLVGGTFGSGGASSSGSFDTYANNAIGRSAKQLLAANFNSGETIIYDDVYATTSTIASGATLSVATDNITASNDFVNNGTLSLGTNNFNIVNDISGSGSINLTIEAGAGGAHGYITNSGGAIDVSTMTFVPTYGAGDVVAGEELVLVANPATLSFDSMAMQSLNGMSWVLSEASAGGTDYQGFAYNSGSLLATSTSIISGVSFVNAPSVEALSNYSGVDADILAQQAGLTSLTNNNQAGAQLRPDATGGNIITALNLLNLVKKNIANQLDFSSTIKDEEEGHDLNFWVGGLGSQSLGEKDIISSLSAFNNAQGGYDIKPGAGVFGSTTRQGVISGASGFESDSYGISFGGDAKIDKNMLIGATLTYANSEVDETGGRLGSGSDIDSYIGSVYGRYNQQGWYLDAILSAGKHSYDTKRLVSFVGNTVAIGSFDSNQYGADIEFNKPLDVTGDYEVTPFVGFSYNTLRQDGYTETGAGGANLVIEDSDVHSYKGYIGTKLKTTFKYDEWIINPIVKIAYKREFNDDLIPNQSVSFSGGGVSFVTPGLDLPQDFLSLGADVEFLSNENVDINLGFDGEYSNSYINNSINLSAKYKF